MAKKKDLVKIIKANPGCVAIVDNDCWWLYKRHPHNDGPPDDSPSYDKWQKDNEIANSDDIEMVGEGYGSGNCYGGDLLQALATIVGIKIESV